MIKIATREPPKVILIRVNRNNQISIIATKRLYVAKKSIEKEDKKQFYKIIKG